MYNSPYGYNGFYQPPVPDQLSQLRQPYSQPYQPPQQTGRIYVQGIEAAKAYLVAPGNTVELWDSELPRIYVKSANVNGVPILQTLEYKDITNLPMRTTEPQFTPEDKFVTRKEFDELRTALGVIPKENGGTDNVK